jgi:uncharacterized protein YegJ (DUF2314 family)
MLKFENEFPGLELDLSKVEKSQTRAFSITNEEKQFIATRIPGRDNLVLQVSIKDDFEYSAAVFVHDKYMTRTLTTWIVSNDPAELKAIYESLDELRMKK